MSSKIENLEENLFGNFKFINEDIPKDLEKEDKNKKEVKEEDKKIEDEISEEEKIALKEAKEASEKKSKKESKSEDKVEELVENNETEEVGEIDNNESEFSIWAKHLNEKGILDLSEDDKIESEEDLERIQIRTIQNGINDYKQSIPEDGQKFLEFIENGGNPSDFHKYYYGDASFEDFNIESEENQKYVITEALKIEGYTDDEINDEINDAVDLGKLEKKASTHLKKLQKLEKEQKELLLETQKNYAREQEELRKNEWESFKKGLFDKDEIGGFKFSNKMKQDTWEYMTKVVEKKQGLTQYQLDSKENSDARYIFAYLLKNKWDIKSLEKQVTTKAVSKLREKLSNYTDTRNKIKSGTPTKQNTEEGSFAGFKTMIT